MAAPRAASPAASTAATSPAATRESNREQHSPSLPIADRRSLHFGSATFQWHLISSFYDYLPWARDGVAVANEPWSGEPQRPHSSAVRSSPNIRLKRFDDFVGRSL